MERERKILVTMIILALGTIFLSYSYGNIFQTIFGIRNVPVLFIQWTGKPSFIDYYEIENGIVSISKNVKIGRYEIYFLQNYKYCKEKGGWGAIYGYKIKRNGIIIDSVPCDCQDGLNHEKEISFDDLYIKFFDSYHSAWYHLDWVQNVYKIKLPKNAFIFDISSPKKSYFRGEKAEVKINVINNLKIPVFAKVIAKICQPTAWGKSCKDFISKTYLNPGNNTITYKVPTQYVVDRLEVTPSLEVWYDLSKINIKGVNVNPCLVFNKNGNSCDKYIRNIYPKRQACKYASVEYCVRNGFSFVRIGKITGKTTTVMIIPKPLYVKVPKDKICPEGYYLSPNEKYCIRNDLKELSCLQLGCPVIPNHTYICTSSGTCAEIVYVYQDCRQLGCPKISGAKEYYCDKNTGACIYKFEKIKKVKINCKNTGCPKMYGVEGKCDVKDGVCIYKIIETKEKKITCKEDPSICPLGTVCDKNTGACIKTEIKEKLIQCKKDSDCYIPCEGVTAKCINNYCDYSGTCKTTYIYINKTIIQNITCRDNPYLCPPGTYCDIKSGLCIKKEITYREIGCKELGGDKACPDGYYCDEKRNVCVRQLTEIEKILTEIEKNKNIIIIATIIIIGVVIWMKKRG